VQQESKNAAGGRQCPCPKPLGEPPGHTENSVYTYNVWGRGLKAGRINVPVKYKLRKKKNAVQVQS